MLTKNNNQRINFASIKNTVNFPDFLDVQLKSFQSFFQIGTTLDERRNEGLYKAFADLFPIADSRNNFVLEFIDYMIDPPILTLNHQDQFLYFYQLIILIKFFSSFKFFKIIS